MAYAVEMRGITKKFGNFIANDQVYFQMEWGEIHGICGENGAGKTTLANTLYGMHQPTSGEMYINGEHVKFANPRDAIDHGIGMVHQHFSLVQSMSVAENIVMAKPPLTPMRLIDRKKSIELTRELSAKHGIEIEPTAIIRDIPVGVQQRVEILKALYLGANILIMDEPTAVLTPQEIEQLFDTLRSLKKLGKSIILITHKLSEVMSVTDKITVMRLGKVTGSKNTCDTNEREIARMMVGREVLMQVEKKPSTPGEVLVHVEDLICRGKTGLNVVDHISFDIQAGEIVGIVGVQGNGQTELIEAVTGMRRAVHGKIVICGQALEGKNLTLKCRENHMGHIAEDRQNVGAARLASIRDNCLNYMYRWPQYAKGLFINYKRFDEDCKAIIDRFDVRYGSIRDSAGSLSGGNLQKLIIAREMTIGTKVIVATQPTRGVDIGATEFVHRQLIAKRDQGCAVLLVTNELSEAMSLSDRLLVIFKGKIIGEVKQDEATEEQLGLWMAGIA